MSYSYGGSSASRMSHSYSYSYVAANRRLGGSGGLGRARRNLQGSDIRDWNAIASSADGARLAATVSSGSIYTSADSGASWTEDATAGARNWVSIAMSADGQRLAAVVQVAFQHHAGDGALAVAALLDHVAGHQRLAARVLAAVGVAAVHHQTRVEPGLRQLLARRLNLLGVVVGAAPAAAQHQVGVRVAGGFQQRRVALVIDAQMGVRVGGRLHGVPGHRDAAVGAVGREP